jgi:hypothetical protein
MSKPPLQFYHQKDKKVHSADSSMHDEPAAVPTSYLKPTGVDMSPVSTIELLSHLLQDLSSSPA